MASRWAFTPVHPHLCCLETPLRLQNCFAWTERTRSSWQFMIPKAQSLSTEGWSASRRGINTPASLPSCWDDRRCDLQCVPRTVTLTLIQLPSVGLWYISFWYFSFCLLFFPVPLLSIHLFFSPIHVLVFPLKRLPNKPLSGKFQSWGLLLGDQTENRMHSTGWQHVSCQDISKIWLFFCFLVFFSW